MSELSEVVGGGTSAPVATAPDVSTESASIEEGRGGTALNDAPLGREGTAHM